MLASGAISGACLRAWAITNPRVRTEMIKESLQWLDLPRSRADGPSFARRRRSRTLWDVRCASCGTNENAIEKGRARESIGAYLDRLEDLTPYGQGLHGDSRRKNQRRLPRHRLPRPASSCAAGLAGCRAGGLRSCGIAA